MNGVTHIIAYFPVDNSVEVVPVNWLTSDFKFAYFPPDGTKNLKKLVKNSSPYKSDWPLFECSIYKKYATYGEARLHLRDAEVASGLSDAGKNKPKATPKPTLPNHPLSMEESSQIQSSNSASSKDSDVNQVTVADPGIAERDSEVSNNLALSNNMTEVENLIHADNSEILQIEQLTNINQMPADHHAGTAESTHSFVLADQEIGPGHFVELPFQPFEIQPCSTCSYLRQEVLTRLTKLELTLQHQTELLNDMKLTPKFVEPESNFKFPVSMFPISSIEGVDNLEKTLIENGEAKKELVRHLLSCGGGTTQAAIENMLRCLITDDILVLHCYIGQRYSKKKTFVGYTSVLQCMLDSLKKNALLKTSDATMESLKEHIPKEFKKHLTECVKRKQEMNYQKKRK